MPRLPTVWLAIARAVPWTLQGEQLSRQDLLQQVW
jgi:hypothetical protein